MKWYYVLIVNCVLLITLNTITYNYFQTCFEKQKQDLSLRYGDEIIIVDGFYAGQKAKISGRRKIAGEYLYHVVGTDVTIDNSTQLRANQFYILSEHN
jgi:hypothetical protein